MTCQEVREEAAATLLRREPLSEAVTGHATTCAECDREIRHLTSTVNLLGLGPPLAAEPQPDDLMLCRLLTVAAGERRRRRIGAVIAGAAAVAFLIPAVYWVTVKDDPGTTAPTASVATLHAAASNRHTGVRGEAGLRAAADGSELDMSVVGVQPGTRCNLVVVDRAGVRSVVDTWTAAYRGDFESTTQSFVPVEQVRRVKLVDASAHSVLLSLSF